MKWCRTKMGHFWSVQAPYPFKTKKNKSYTREVGGSSDEEGC